MISLQQFATKISTTEYRLPSGTVVRIPTWTVRFPPASPPRLPDGTLKSTYTIKPLVDVDSESVFGEIAIIRWLAKDGWSALWADTFHGRKFWRDMPHRSESIEPPSPVRDLYNHIAELKGGPSGCFDVVAWRASQILWLEYKGPRDKPNQNEALWIDAAMRGGVTADDLVFVGAARGTAPIDAMSVRPRSIAGLANDERAEPHPPRELQSENHRIFEPIDDRNYYAWLNSHPLGYVLSLKSKKEPILHRADCTHIDRNNNSITRARKICSDDRKALGVWVREHGLGNGIVLNKCRSCAP